MNYAFFFSGWCVEILTSKYFQSCSTKLNLPHYGLILGRVPMGQYHLLSLIAVEYYLIVRTSAHGVFQRYLGTSSRFVAKIYQLIRNDYNKYMGIAY